ncbi:serine/threonine-kinase ATM-like protein [Actinidia rufa]|uniref:Serine/threonine-kinase ATM-like protein n=1 Tax=Actinidia rufa TaxID=165716 RepID=A0A7J0FYJ4_9ERIC|nr:serine/threonine-kinase ATM-like protein [Actinidia rufa]
MDGSSRKIFPEHSQSTAYQSSSTLEDEMRQRKPYKGLIRSLQQLGSTHVLDLYCQGLTSRKGQFEHDLEFSELQYEAAWRAGNWDFSLLYMGANSPRLSQDTSDHFHEHLYRSITGGVIEVSVEENYWQVVGDVLLEVEDWSMHLFQDIVENWRNGNVMRGMERKMGVLDTRGVLVMWDRWMVEKMDNKLGEFPVTCLFKLDWEEGIRQGVADFYEELAFSEEEIVDDLKALNGERARWPDERLEWMDGAEVVLSCLWYLDDPICIYGAHAIIRCVLLCFEVSGLRLNLGKWKIIPVGVVPNVEAVASVLARKVGALPFYLGLPLGGVFQCQDNLGFSREKIPKEIGGVQAIVFVEQREAYSILSHLAIARNPVQPLLKAKDFTPSSTTLVMSTSLWDKSCGAYFTAVLYVEHWCEEHFNHLMLGSPDFSHIDTLPHHIEILVSAVTQINEPDSLYGIIQSHKVELLGVVLGVHMQGRVIGRCSVHPLEDAEACNAWKRATDILGCVGEASLVVRCSLEDEDHQIVCGRYKPLWSLATYNSEGLPRPKLDELKARV